jgi:hypothetical protein
MGLSVVASLTFHLHEDGIMSRAGANMTAAAIGHMIRTRYVYGLLRFHDEHIFIESTLNPAFCRIIT